MNTAEIAPVVELLPAVRALSETLEVKNDNVVAFAALVGVELQGTLDERADLASLHTAASTKHDVAAGLLWMSIKAETPHGGMAKIMEERGADPRAVQRSVTVAEFVLRQPQSVQSKLLATPKTKVLELAKADPEVLKIALEDGEAIDIDALSVRELRTRLKELEAEKVTADVNLEKATSELEAIKQKANKTSRADNIPVVVADLREDLTAELKKADLAEDAIRLCLQELVALKGGAADMWVEPTVRLALAGMAGLILRMDGLMRSLIAQAPTEGGVYSEFPPASYLSPDEVSALALRYSELTRQANHEKELREWTRKQARPQGRGRPTAKPTLSGR